MKEILEARSNIMFHQLPEQSQLEVLPMIEIVIIHTNGYQYIESKNGGFKKTQRIDELRFVCGKENLNHLIAGLQIAARNVNVAHQNAEIMNLMFKDIKEAAEARK